MVEFLRPLLSRPPHPVCMYFNYKLHSVGKPTLCVYIELHDGGLMWLICRCMHYLHLPLLLLLPFFSLWQKNKARRCLLTSQVLVVTFVLKSTLRGVAYNNYACCLVGQTWTLHSFSLPPSHSSSKHLNMQPDTFSLSFRLIQPAYETRTTDCVSPHIVMKL